MKFRTDKFLLEALPILWHGALRGPTLHAGLMRSGRHRTHIELLWVWTRLVQISVHGIGGGSHLIHLAI